MDKNNPNVKACCKVDSNLRVVDAESVGITIKDPTLVVRQCQVCKCRHLEVEAEPVHVGVKMA